MKLGLFTDSHYSSQKITCGNRYNSLSLEKIREAMTCFADKGCDLAVCLGDLIDHEPDHQQEIANLQKVSEVVHASSVPFVSLMGNHDAFSFSVDEFYRILGEDCRPTGRTVGHARLLFLDACYFHTGTHYQPGDTDWTDTCFPYPDRLRMMLDADPSEAIVFLHQNVDPDLPASHMLCNAAELCRIMEASGRVKTVFQGHFHDGHTSVHHGIAYHTLPAMCCGTGRRYIFEYAAEKKPAGT